MLELAKGLVPKETDSPEGIPEAEQVTLPVNVPISVTVRVSVALLP